MGGPDGSKGESISTKRANIPLPIPCLRSGADQLGAEHHAALRIGGTRDYYEVAVIEVIPSPCRYRRDNAGEKFIHRLAKQITRLKIELVPVAQRELEIQAATDFLEGYYVHDYLQLPQNYCVDQVFVVIST
jgi:hypothetical protein